MKKTTEQFIADAKKVHGDKYDYSKVEYINNLTKVCIICPKHGEFWQRPANHLKGQGCPLCSGVIKKTTEQFIADAKKVHGDKYDYSKVDYNGNKGNICIICHNKDNEGNEHGEFYQQALTHLRGFGCPKCSNNYRKNTEEFIDASKKVHGDKYDYSKVKYINNNTKVCIICHKKDYFGNEHGEFWQSPKNHLNGENCPKCAGKNKTQEDVLFRLKKIHNNKYDYSKFNYVNVRTKSCIICPIHGEFWQTPNDHLQGYGCPSCSHTQSNQELDLIGTIKSFSNEIKLEIKNKKILNGKELDIYIPEKNLAVEYDGLIWHSEKFGKDKNYHLNKTIECEKQGIRLIHIFEDEWLEHKDIVKSKLKHILGCDGNLPKVFARKCTVKEIKYNEAKDFLEKNHIQGFVNSSVYLGCFFDNEVIGVASFKKERKISDKWELTRFATDINKLCIGVGGKLFNFFVKNYCPIEVKSFADRRWTISTNNNLYTKIGFELEKILKPDYKYVLRNERIHKFNFRKAILLKKFKYEDLNNNMSEYEMTQKLGFYRIWDCGLYKYVWKNNIF